MRILAIVAALSLFTNQAQACVQIRLPGAYAEGRVRGADRDWRPMHLESQGKSIRIEYDDPRTAWGRIVLIGDIANGKADLFPIAFEGLPPTDARVIWRTSWGLGLPEIGLDLRFLQKAFMHDISSPTSELNGIPCRFPIERYSVEGEFSYDRSICVNAETYLPVYMNDANGHRVFEMTKLVVRKIDPRRFKIPSTYQVTDIRPAYLDRFTC